MNKCKYISGRLLPLLFSVIICAGVVTPSAYADEPVAKIDVPQLQSLISGNKGKVTIVNFWATWCPPCLKEFPDFVKLYNAYHSKGLEIVAVSMNEPDEMEDIQEFLQKYKPPFPIYLAASADEDFYQAISKDWMGTIPLTLIFDTEGKSAYYHHKEVNFSGLEKDISPLLPKE